MNFIHKLLLLSSLFFFLFVQNSYSQVVRGEVKDEDGSKVTNAYVLLVYIDENEEVVLLDWSSVNSDGKYQFTGHRQYVSYIAGFPNDPLDYVQTYYPAGLDWSEAEALDPNRPYTSADITMQECEGVDNLNAGSNHFKGSIISSEFLKSLSDVTVYVKHQGQLLSYVRSNFEGNFEIELPNGTYEITASKFGYEKEVRNITVTNEISKIDLNFELSAAAVNPSQNFIFPGLAELQGGKYNKREANNINVTSQVKLDQNRPNPFNPETSISFIIPENGNVQLNVFDISGREVARLINEYRIAGSHSVSFNASKLPTGVYFYRLSVNSTSIVKKMLLIK